MKTKPGNGFSVVELMVGIASGAMIALVFVALLVFSYKGWFRLSAERDMLREADVTMRTMDRIVRSGSNAVVTAGASNLTVQVAMTNGVMVHSFQKTGTWPTSHLLYTPPGGSSSVLVSNRVNTFSCAWYPTNSLVTINLGLREGSETLDMPLSIFLRN
ncbi:MAG: hypothetical protein WCI03_14410 [bacterium]